MKLQVLLKQKLYLLCSTETFTIVLCISFMFHTSLLDYAVTHNCYLHNFMYWFDSRRGLYLLTAVLKKNTTGYNIIKSKPKGTHTDKSARTLVRSHHFCDYFIENINLTIQNYTT